jgi:hypothetical protein
MDVIDSLNYKVFGTKGTIYDVCISKKPTCTCMDYKLRKKRCKHIYFVLIRVMKVLNPDKLNYSENDLDLMIKNIPKEIDVFYNGKVEKIGKIKKEVKYEQIKLNVEPKIYDNCPICLDSILNDAKYLVCNNCGRCIHSDCFGQYIKCSRKPKNCLFCNYKMI